jgi:tetratricopeptide (TPR) repeat protein
VPKEFPKHAKAPTAMMNAGVMYEDAKQPEKAADVYLELASSYKGAPEGEKAAFAAGQVYERVAYFDRAAEAYEVVVKDFPKSAKAPDALYNAGVLRQALGQHDKAIAHFQAYAKKYDDRKDAAEVAFRIGVVYEEAGDDGHADAAYRSYAKNYRDNPRRVIEAHVRAARTSLALGQWKRTADELDETSKAYKRADPKDRAATRTWAAEGRYLEGELVLRDYEKVSLDVKPKLLQKTLKKKSELLGKAQGIYLSVVDYEDLKWATASLYRVGQIYDSFAEALRTAPTPAGLSEAEATAYRDPRQLRARHRGEGHRAVLDRLRQGDPDAGVRRLHEEDPRRAGAAVVAAVPARAREPRRGPRRRSPARRRPGRRGGAMRRSSPALVGRAAAARAPPPDPDHRPKAQGRLDPVKPEARREFDGDVALRWAVLRRPRPPRPGCGRGRHRPAWEAWHDLGVLRAADGDDEAAAAAFDKALAVNPSLAPSRVARAEVLRRLGKAKDARADYEQMLRESEPDDPLRRDAAARLASLLRDGGSYDDAIDVLRDTLRVSGANARIYTELGLLYLAQNREELASLVVKRAIELDAKDPAAYNALALLYLRQGKAQEAFDRFDYATSLDPGYLDARFNKASVLLDAGDYTRAKAELDVIVGKRPDDWGAQVALGLALRGQKDFDPAKKLWQTVVDQAPRRSRARGDALWNLAVLKSDFLEDVPGAKADLERFLQDGSGHPSAWPPAEARSWLVTTPRQLACGGSAPVADRVPSRPDGWWCAWRCRRRRNAAVVAASPSPRRAPPPRRRLRRPGPSRRAVARSNRPAPPRRPPAGRRPERARPRCSTSPASTSTVACARRSSCTSSTAPARSSSARRSRSARSCPR